MPGGLLQTKLRTPKPRPGRVARPRLLERLDQGLDGKLTLVSAPAGFGKTTLLSAWASGLERPVAWLSLDEGERAAGGFLRYLVAALQSVDPRVGAEAASLLQAPQPPPVDAILTLLVNELGRRSEAIVVVLDDLHRAESAPVVRLLSSLLDHQPPQLHLVLAGRSDPDLPLARLRVQGELTELRASELRFTSAESEAFLNRMMELDLGDELVAALDRRTEGWIAGLQLAAHSLRGRDDPSAFVAAFTGSHRFVLDYLVEEVLDRQPEAVRAFLERTAILDRLSAPLCDAVTGGDDGRSTLAVLERENLFVEPLDDEGRWYRYHPLFAEVLRSRSGVVSPDRTAELHLRASRWHERHDAPAEAIRHALAAGAHDRAAGLIQRAWPVLRRERHESVLLGWAENLPEAVVRARPYLGVQIAQALLSTNPDLAESRLRDAEAWLADDEGIEAGVEPLAQDGGPPGETVLDADERRALPGMIAVARAYRAGALRDAAATRSYALRALELLPRSEHLGRGSAAVLLGLSHWTEGDLDAAHRSVAEGLASLRRTGNVGAIVGTASLQADLRLAQGRLREAGRIAQRTLDLAANHAVPVRQGTADVHVVASAVYREWNELDVAGEHLRTSRALGEHAGLVELRHRWHVARALLDEARGRYDEALALLDEAERLQAASPAPDVRPVAACRARLWLRQGRLADAVAWARERGLSGDDAPSYLREFEHLILARILVARYRADRDRGVIAEASGLLERLLRAAAAGARPGSAIEVQLLQALVLEAQGEIHAALVPLRRALALAEPEGYLRRFVDEGPAVARLLEAALSAGIAPAYARHLMSAFAAPGASARVADAELAEPLSGREVEVLAAMAEGLTNPQIADRLDLALNTVKVHSRNIYGKLYVHNRMQAVAKARALGILASD